MKKVDLTHHWKNYADYDKYDWPQKSVMGYRDYQCIRCGVIKTIPNDNNNYPTLYGFNVEKNWYEKVLPCNEIIMNNVME